MGYELASLKLEVVNNYVKVTREENDTSRVLPTKTTIGWYGKSASSFRFTYELVKDPKGTQTWQIDNVIVSSGTTQFSFSNADVVNALVTDGKGLPFTIITLGEFLSLNTGL